MTTNETPAVPVSEDVLPGDTKASSKLPDALDARDVAYAAEEQAALDQPAADSGIDTSAAKSALEERKRLMPEYLDHFFLEDLPPIDTEDPFNQGIYMRYRLNQIRDVSGKEPVL